MHSYRQFEYFIYFYILGDLSRGNEGPIIGHIRTLSVCNHHQHHQDAQSFACLGNKQKKQYTVFDMVLRAYLVSLAKS